jgi:hypothetical protein
VPGIQEVGLKEYRRIALLRRYPLNFTNYAKQVALTLGEQDGSSVAAIGIEQSRTEQKTRADVIPITLGPTAKRIATRRISVSYQGRLRNQRAGESFAASRPLAKGNQGHSGAAAR